MYVEKLLNNILFKSYSLLSLNNSEIGVTYCFEKYF